MALPALNRSFHGGVEAGSVYRRLGVGALVEMARVIDVRPDRMGIPHVRYELRVGHGHAGTEAGKRTLALEAFLSRYREKVPERRKPVPLSG